MEQHWFYETDFDESTQFNLSEVNAHHAVQVLRLTQGNGLVLTNGRGKVARANLLLAQKRKATVAIQSTEMFVKTGRRFGVAIPLLKNAARFEWFIEKATELGITDIFVMETQRTIRSHYKAERTSSICISAMLQSQQAWLPTLHAPLPLGQLLKSPAIQSYPLKAIAHCVPTSKQSFRQLIANNQQDACVTLIGPEGDFTNPEIDEALQHQFVPVSMGDTRLRTETAAVVAAALMQ